MRKVKFEFFLKTFFPKFLVDRAVGWRGPKCSVVCCDLRKCRFLGLLAAELAEMVSVRKVGQKCGRIVCLWQQH